MKIAIIVKKELIDSKIYTTHHFKVTYHTNNIFLNYSDKSAIECALSLVKKDGGKIDAFTMEKGVLAERILHEALALGVDRAMKLNGVNSDDPLNSISIAESLANLFSKEKYDIILSGYSEESDVISAGLAVKLGFTYYDHVASLNNKLNYQTRLEKGQITGQIQLPAVVSVLNAVSVPHLPSFMDLRNSFEQKIAEKNLKVKNLDNSEIIANQSKNKKQIFDLSKNPAAVDDFVAALKQDGILK